jgi:hypothetical protein
MQSAGEYKRRSLPEQKYEGKREWLNIRQVEVEDTSVAKSCYKATWPFWVFVCCSLWLALFVNSTLDELQTSFKLSLSKIR